MAIKLASKTNVTAPNAEFPYGNIKDNTGGIPGTPVNVKSYADFHQFFAKINALLVLEYNDLPDSQTNGFEFVDRLLELMIKRLNTQFVAQSAAEANQWKGIAFGNGLFVAVSSGGTSRVMTSPDGITWTPRTAAEANQWQAVTFGNGLFVAVSADGTSRVMTSPDGITWTSRTAAEDNDWQAIISGNGVNVAVSLDGTNRVMKAI